ncbi:MAG: hypothetical protein ACYSW8_03190 [Planctomycetota bacterium]|jgi:hypothetical protein
MKSIRVIAVTIVFLVVSTQAGRALGCLRRMDDPDPHGLCVLPIFIDLPSYVTIWKKGGLSVHLEESIDALAYEGCTDFQVLCLMDITSSCKIKSNGKVSGEYSCQIENEHVPFTGDVPATRSVCVKVELEKVPLVNAVGQDRQVATVTLTVAPRA